MPKKKSKGSNLSASRTPTPKPSCLPLVPPKPPTSFVLGDNKNEEHNNNTAHDATQFNGAVEAGNEAAQTVDARSNIILHVYPSEYVGASPAALPVSRNSGPPHQDGARRGDAMQQGKRSSANKRPIGQHSGSSRDRDAPGSGRDSTDLSTIDRWWNGSRSTSKEEQIRFKDEQIERLQQEIHVLRDASRQHMTRIDNLNSDLVDALRITEQQQRFVTELQTEAAKYSPAYQPSPFDDQAIRKPFRDMGRSVRKWSSYLSDNSLEKPQVTDEKLFNYYKFIVPGCTSVRSLVDLLQDKTDRRNFAEGWIGLFVASQLSREHYLAGVKRFFENLGLVLHGSSPSQAEEAVEVLLTKFETCDREVQTRWHSLTQMLLAEVACQKNSRDDDQSRACAEIIMKLFQPWLKPDPDALKGLETKLAGILQQVTELCRRLRRQTEHWTIKQSGVSCRMMQSTDPLFFNGEGMSDRDSRFEMMTPFEQDNAVVQFLIWPGIYKGREDEYACVEPETVLCLDAGSDAEDE